MARVRSLDARPHPQRKRSAGALRRVGPAGLSRQLLGDVAALDIEIVTRRPALLRLNVEQLDFKHQSRIRRDRTDAATAVTELRRYHEFALSAHLHRHDAFIPALDDLSDADFEFERLAAIQRTVEFGSVFEGAGVMHSHFLPGLRAWARSDDYVFVPQS